MKDLLKLNSKKTNSKLTSLNLSVNRYGRLKILRALLSIFVIIIVSRLYSLQVSNQDTWQEWALKQHFEDMKIASERGPIVDTEGRYLAVSVPAGSIYVRPKQIKNREETVAFLAKELQIAESLVKEKITKKSPFVWIRRQIPRDLALKIAESKMPGVGYVLESRRYYPYGSAAGVLIGKVGIDGEGLSGLELSHNKKLYKAETIQSVRRDALGNQINIKLDNSGLNKSFAVPRGDEVQLSIDVDLQLVLDEELEKSQKEQKAKSVMAVLADADNGEIIALGQSPNMNPNFEIVKDQKAPKNLLMETVYEPGSTMKPLVAAAAIDSGVISASNMINCEHGRYSFGSHLIKDVHPVDTVTFRDVVVRSSNIGMTKVGAMMGKDALYKSLRNFGFGFSSKLGIAGESAGILRHVSGWATVDIATHSFGQGIAVTPLQMVRATSALVNGGELVQLKLIKNNSSGNAGETDRVRVISPKTSEIMKQILYDVVEDPHGTGKSAKIEGIRVGGKTGTAQKARTDGKGYLPNKYMASFVGFADAENIGISKKLTMIVIVDEPSNGAIYGGAVAAPVFQKIMRRSLQVLSTRKDLGKDVSRENESGLALAVSKS